MFIILLVDTIFNKVFLDHILYIWLVTQYGLLMLAVPNCIKYKSVMLKSVIVFKENK